MYYFYVFRIREDGEFVFVKEMKQELPYALGLSQSDSLVVITEKRLEDDFNDVCVNLHDVSLWLACNHPRLATGDNQDWLTIGIGPFLTRVYNDHKKKLASTDASNEPTNQESSVSLVLDCFSRLKNYIDGLIKNKTSFCQPFGQELAVTYGLYVVDKDKCILTRICYFQDETKLYKLVASYRHMGVLGIKSVMSINNSVHYSIIPVLPTDVVMDDYLDYFVFADNGRSSNYTNSFQEQNETPASTHVTMTLSDKYPDPARTIAFAQNEALKVSFKGEDKNASPTGTTFIKLPPWWEQPVNTNDLHFNKFPHSYNHTLRQLFDNRVTKIEVFSTDQNGNMRRNAEVKGVHLKNSTSPKQLKGSTGDNSDDILMTDDEMASVVAFFEVGLSNGKLTLSVGPTSHFTGFVRSDDGTKTKIPKDVVFVTKSKDNTLEVNIGSEVLKGSEFWNLVSTDVFKKCMLGWLEFYLSNQIGVTSYKTKLTDLIENSCNSSLTKIVSTLYDQVCNFCVKHNFDPLVFLSDIFNVLAGTATELGEFAVIGKYMAADPFFVLTLSHNPLMKNKDVESILKFLISTKK